MDPETLKLIKQLRDACAIGLDEMEACLVCEGVLFGTEGGKFCSLDGPPPGAIHPTKVVADAIRAADKVLLT